MDKRKELLKKLHLLVQEIDKAKEMVDEEKCQYLNNYKNRIELNSHRSCNIAPLVRA